MGHGGRSERLHRLQRLRDRVPGRKQHSDCRQTSGVTWTRDALDPDRSLLRERETVQRGRWRISGEPGDGASTDDVSALRERAVRNGLSGERDRSTARTASTSWLTTAASAPDIARTTARSKCAGSISSITTSGRSAKRKSPDNSASTRNTSRRSPKRARRTSSSCRRTRTSRFGCAA